MSKIWLFELYGKDKEVVYSSLIDDESGKNRVLLAVDDWPDKFIVESFFLYSSAEQAIRWSGKTMNTMYFIDDLRADLALAKKSVPSFENATEDFDNHEFILESFRKLQQCGDMLAKLHVYAPELRLPFKPTEDEIIALKLVSDYAVESSRKEYQWHEYPSIPEPDRSYVEALEELLSNELSKAQADGIKDAEELQEEISKLAAYYGEFYEDDYDYFDKEDYYDIAGIVTAQSIPRYLSERATRDESEDYEIEPLIVPAALNRLANHPDSCFLAGYFRAHASVPGEKLLRFKQVIELYPTLVRKFQNSSYSERHWVYRAYGEEGTLLYIGQTSSPLLRLRQHAGLDTQAQRLFGEDSRKRVVSKWFPKLDRIEWQPFSNPIEAHAAEAAFIDAEAPVYNTVFNKKNSRYLLENSQTVVTPPPLEDPRNVNWERFRPSHVQLPVYGFERNI